MLYVWGVRYFPHSHFGIVYKKLSKYCLFPLFPSDFKFYREDKVGQIEKRQNIVDIDVFAGNRKNVEVPALSDRKSARKKSVEIPLSSVRSANNESNKKIKEENPKVTHKSPDNAKVNPNNVAPLAQIN